MDSHKAPNKRRRVRKKRTFIKYVRPSLQLAWRPETNDYSPRRVFAYWGKLPVLEKWTEQGLDLDGASIRLALNYPEYILRSFNRWYVAQTDNDFLLFVPWKEFDLWLKINGFSGKSATKEVTYGRSHT